MRHDKTLLIQSICFHTFSAIKIGLWKKTNYNYFHRQVQYITLGTGITDLITANVRNYLQMIIHITRWTVPVYRDYTSHYQFVYYHFTLLNMGKCQVHVLPMCGRHNPNTNLNKTVISIWVQYTLNRHIRQKEHVWNN
jgi:hypothetical protein